jgi:hypothetical protein
LVSASAVTFVGPPWTASGTKSSPNLVITYDLD